MRFFNSIAALLLFFLSCQMANARVREADQKVVSGIVLLNSKTSPDPKGILNALKKDWKLNFDSANVADKTIVFTTSSATVMIAFLDYPVPPAEIRTAAGLSWLWRGANDEALKHQSQMVVSVIGTTAKVLDLYKIFTKVTACVLEHSESSGFYMSGQYLLLSRDFYISAARNMRDHQTIPLYCWVYFGMIAEKDVASGYTYGMQEFGCKEMEIAEAKLKVQEVHAVLYDAAMTILQYNLKLEDGKEFTTLEGQKLTPVLSKAAFQEGETFKFKF
ncbi:MAG: DUF4261 domain-containing protein [Lewinellaceae bacterium]|nr:DUF4261 domain-containing protein [Lewinellaceae bacterium]